MPKHLLWGQGRETRQVALDFINISLGCLLWGETSHVLGSGGRISRVDTSRVSPALLLH